MLLFFLIKSEIERYQDTLMEIYIFFLYHRILFIKLLFLTIIDGFLYVTLRKVGV